MDELFCAAMEMPKMRHAVGRISTEQDSTVKVRDGLVASSLAAAADNRTG
jgi:hypothetical protein